MTALTRKQARQLMRLLGKFQTHLESAIESSIPQPLPKGGAERLHVILTAQVKDDFADCIELDRRDWRAAEAWVKRLECGQ